MDPGNLNFNTASGDSQVGTRAQSMQRGNYIIMSFVLCIVKMLSDGWCILFRSTQLQIEDPSQAKPFSHCRVSHAEETFLSMKKKCHFASASEFSGVSWKQFSWPERTMLRAFQSSFIFSEEDLDAHVHIRMCVCYVCVQVCMHVHVCVYKHKSDFL